MITAATMTEVAPHASMLAMVSGTKDSRPYTDRSNCRRAMAKFAAEAGLSVGDFEVFKIADKDFRFQRTSTTPVNAITEFQPKSADTDGVPDFLKISPAQRREAWAKCPPRDTRPVLAPKEATMTKPKTKPTTAKSAQRARADQVLAHAVSRVSKKAATKKIATPAGDRARYNWAKAEEDAGNGKVPAALDFSAETHARFRETLKAVVTAAKAGDIKALTAITIKPVSSSPKALDRYRNLCVKALKAAA